MSPQVLRAVVLRTRPYSETSLWIRLFSQSHGKLSGIAKGARKGKDRLFTPLIEVEVTGYPPRSDEHTLWNLPRPELVTDWRELTRNPDAMVYAWGLLEVTDKLMQEMEPHPESYDNLSASLDALLGKTAHPAATFLWYLVRLTDELGYALQYEICPRCGHPLVFPVGGFARVEGGVLCRSCHASDRGVLAEAVWETLVTVAVSVGPPDFKVPDGARDSLLNLLVDYLGYHADKPLKLEALKLLRSPR